MNRASARQRFGVRQSSGALDLRTRHRSIEKVPCEKAPADWRTPKPGGCNDGAGCFSRHWSFEIRHSSVAFTLLDLLVILAVLGVLAATIVPVRARSGLNVRTFQCQNNVKQ